MSVFIILIVIFMLGLLLMAAASLSLPIVNLGKEFKCYNMECKDKYLDIHKYIELVFEGEYVLKVHLKEDIPYVLSVERRQKDIYKFSVECPTQLKMSQNTYDTLKEKGIIDILEGK